MTVAEAALVEAIRAIQRSTGWTDAQVAGKLGVSRALWARYRSGKGSPGRRFIGAVSVAFPALGRECQAAMWADVTPPKVAGGKA